MSTAQYQLTWDSYKKNVCDGFTNLQQNEEFVDMTLAADGHLVKVHRNIFALASPYIKSMLQSTSNDHPILFISNISHDVLNYILTYVYTGEVSVKSDKIHSFMRVAKDLRLSGLCDTQILQVDSRNSMKSNIRNQTCMNNTIPDLQIPNEDRVTNNLFDSVNATETALANIELLDTTVSPLSAEQINIVKVENITSSSNINIQKESALTPNEEMLDVDSRDNGCYMTADGYKYKLDLQQPYNKLSDSTPKKFEDNCNNSSDIITVDHDNNDNFGSFEEEFKKQICQTSTNDFLQSKDISLQYTVSNRGSLQLILNRFMYYCHHQSQRGRKRRWRCIEYRSKYCPAYIDTDNEMMTSRKFKHCHSFHDEKIRTKMKKNILFTNLNDLLEDKKRKTES